MAPLSPEQLHILVGRAVHHFAFRNIATVAVREKTASRRRERAG